MSVECLHPTSSVRWDRHRAVLRCEACGRTIRLNLDDDVDGEPVGDAT